MAPDIIVEHQNVFETDVEAVALPTDGDLSATHGSMAYAESISGGLDRSSAAAGLDMGDAVWLNPGRTGYQGIFGLVVCEDGNQNWIPGALSVAVEDALQIAQRRRLRSVGFVGIDTEDDNLSQVASEMLDAIRAHHGEFPAYVVLADTNPAMIDAWRAEIDE